MLRALLLPTLLIVSQPVAAGERPAKVAPITVAAGDWPWWRGTGRDGIAADGKPAPTRWSETGGVAWKVAIPGRGHGSPTIVGSRIFLATADRGTQTQALLCLDRKTGKTLWQTVVHRGPLETRGNKKSSLASCSPACDGQRVYVNFLSKGAVITSALDLDGRILWQTRITRYQTHQGFSSSPCLFGPLVLVSADNRAGGAVAALSRETGRVAWTQSRPSKANYTSPIVLRVSGRDQAVMVGTNLVSSFDPLSGKKLWEIEGATTECVTSVVTDGTRVITSGGYPRNHVSAILADGSGRTAWANKQRVYVPSMLVHKGTLYAVLDAGIATAWDTATGKTLWKKRLGGVFTSSLVLAADNIYATDETGKTTVFKADRSGLKIVAQNQLGDESMASMAICGGRIYHRVATRTDGKRREWLFCLAP